VVKYPQCRPYSGKAKVICLINAIISDYRAGIISRELAKARLRYLIALNKANNWMDQRELKTLVKNALARISTLGILM